MNRLSGPTLTCACGREVVVSSDELRAWRTGELDLWRIVEVMKAVRGRCDHTPCASSSKWAIVVTARILELDAKHVAEKYDEFLEWLEGR